MSTKQGSGRSLRALSVMLILLLLAIFVILILVIASEMSAHTSMLHDFSRLLSGEAGASRAQLAVVVVILLGAVALPLAIMLISILTRNARNGEHRHAVLHEQQQGEMQVLHSSLNALSGTIRTQSAGIEHASANIYAAEKACREVSRQLLEGSRFESAHLQAASGMLSRTVAVMDEMTVYAAESAAVAAQSLQQGGDETDNKTENEAAAAAQQADEAFIYLADFLRRISQVAEKQSGSIAAVGRSIESISEISHRNAASAAVLNTLADELQQ